MVSVNAYLPWNLSVWLDTTNRLTVLDDYKTIDYWQFQDCFKRLDNNKISGWSILKVCADEKLMVFIECCFTPLSTAFQSYQQFKLFMPFLGFTSTRLGLSSALPKDIPMKNPEDPMRLKPRTPGLRVKHFTAEPRRPLKNWSWKFVIGQKTLWEKEKMPTTCTSTFTSAYLLCSSLLSIFSPVNENWINWVIVSNCVQFG